jgi:hypothetical protein
MKINTWTRALISAGIISLPAVAHAEERTNAVLSALSATSISGYVDTSAQWNVGTGDAHVPTYSFGGPGKADGFNLNVVKLTVEKPIEPTDSWGAGYKVDLLFGPDANALATQSTGTASDFGVKQAYVALRAPVGNGLDFKLGVWDTIIGYEVFESANNPNFTRSYGYTIEPTTHTGLLMSYQFNEIVSANVGVANTFGPTINGRAFPTPSSTTTDGGPKAESYKTYMGSVVLTAPKDWGFLAGSTLTGCVINGFNTGSVANQTSWFVGTTVNTPISALKLGASYDYAGVSEQPLSGASYANAFAFYASYQLTEKMTLYGRGEYATSDTAVFGTSKVVATTATLQYDLWKNVLSRIEFRWDHSADGSNAYGGVNATDAPTKQNSYILMANVVYKF